MYQSSECDELKKCLNCNSKVRVVRIDSTYSEIGECTKCRMMQNTESCETLLTTRIFVKSEMPSPMSLTATGDMVHKLCCYEDTKITKMALITNMSF